MFSNCTTGKRQYSSAAEAQSTLDRLIRRWNDGTIADPCFAKRAYKCPFCGDYHLTKKDAHRFNPTDVFPTLPLPKGIAA